MELLERHSEGVIALTGCLQSRFCQRLIQEREQEARAHADELLGVFGADNVYFEVQNNKIPEQDRANEGIVRIARELGRPLVGTADVHYLRREDYSTHAALLCVQTKSTLAAAEAALRHERVLSEGPGRDGGVVPRVAGGRPDHARDRRALRHRAGARQHAAAELPRRPTARRRPTTCAASRRRACASATATRRPPTAVERLETELRRDRGDGLRVLLPDRLGLRQVREGQRHRGRARAAARRRARSSATCCASPTSTRSPRT